MNYGELVRRPFQIVRRRPYLWLLGFLAGGAATYNFNFGQSSWRRSAPASYRGPDWNQVSAVWAQNWQWLVAIGAALAVLALVWFVLSCIASGGIVRAAAVHDSGRDFGLGAAWHAGMSTGWRVAGLRVLVLLLALAPAVLLGSLAAVSVGAAFAGSAAAAVLLGLLTAIGALAAAAFWLVLSVAYELGLRHLVLEDGRVAESLTAGFQAVRSRFGPVAVGWLILLGISIGAGVAFAILAVIVAIPLAAIAVAGWAAAGSTGLLFTVPFAVVFWAGAVAAAGGAYSAYSSVYWTLLFTRLGSLPARAAGMPAPLPA